MYARLSLGLIALLTTSVAATDDFLGIERYLQVPGTVFTTTCTADANCAAGNCCSQLSRVGANGALTAVSRICVNPWLSGRYFIQGTNNFTFSCPTPALITAAQGTACTTFDGCTATATSCCL